MSLKYNKIAIIGYSGHAYVVCDIFISMGYDIVGYYEPKEKDINPYNLRYLGDDKLISSHEGMSECEYFVAIGDNRLRATITNNIKNGTNGLLANAIHKNASISTTVSLGNAVMISDGAIINACTKIQDGVICNTQSVVEHDCNIGSYSHIAPGAVLCGNVEVGSNTFIGARAVVKQGVTIGDNVIVGAGCVVINDIPNNTKVVGNPQKIIQ